MKLVGKPLDKHLLSQIGCFFLLAILTLILQQGVYIADSLIVGNILGKAEFAAITASTTVLRLPVNVAVGFSSGITIILAHALENRRNDKEGKIVSAGLHASILVGIIVTITAFAFAPMLLRWSQVPGAILSNALLCFRIYLFGTVFVFFTNICIGAIRAYEDALSPLLVMGGSLLLNILLDFLFVYAFDLPGAAIATVLTQAGTAIASGFLLRKHYRISFYDAVPFKGEWKSILEVFTAGLPIAIQIVLFTVTGLYAQRVVNLLDTDAIAQWGICNRVDTPIWVIIDATVLTATTFFSRAFGAKDNSKIIGSMKITSLWWYSLLSYLLYYLFSPLIYQNCF